MQQWGYLEVYVAQQQWLDSTGRFGELADITGDGPIREYFYNSTPLLNELGVQGWEVTGIVPTPSSGWYTVNRPEFGGDSGYWELAGRAGGA